MTIVTGTSDFQALFQGLLSEVVIVNGQPYGVPVVKLTADSLEDEPTSLYIASGTVFVGNYPNPQIVSGSVNVNNFPALQIVSGSVLSLDFPTYGQWDYFGNAIYSGTNLYHGVFRRGGSSGTVVATLDLTYDASDNLLTVTKT